MTEKAKKDLWDKFSIISSFVSSIIITVLIFCISDNYQREQENSNKEFKRIELLQNLLPYLSTKDPMQNRVAILTLSALGYDSLAVELGGLINSPGTRKAIQELSQDKQTIKSSSLLYQKKWNSLKNMPIDSVSLLKTEDGYIIMTEDSIPLLVK